MALLQGKPLGRLLLSEKSDSRIDRSIFKIIAIIHVTRFIWKNWWSFLKETYVAEKFFTSKNLIADLFQGIFSKYSENLFWKDFRAPVSEKRKSLNSMGFLVFFSLSLFLEILDLKLLWLKLLEYFCFRWQKKKLNHYITNCRNLKEIKYP